MYNFNVWDVSDKFLMAFMKYRGSSGIKEANKMEKEIFGTFQNFQNSFHSAVNAFTALKWKHDETKPRREETNLYGNIMRIIVLLKRWLLQMKQGYCMGNKDKKHSGIIQIGNKASYTFRFLWICSNLTETPEKTVLLVITYSPLV